MGQDINQRHLYKKVDNYPTPTLDTAFILSGIGKEGIYIYIYFVNYATKLRITKVYVQCVKRGNISSLKVHSNYTSGLCSRDQGYDFMLRYCIICKLAFFFYIKFLPDSPQSNSGTFFSKCLKNLYLVVYSLYLYIKFL